MGAEGVRRLATHGTGLGKALDPTEPLGMRPYPEPEAGDILEAKYLRNEQHVVEILTALKSY